MTPGSVLPKLHRRLPNGNERRKKLGEENLALNESGSIKEGGGGGNLLNYEYELTQGGCVARSARYGGRGRA